MFLYTTRNDFVLVVDYIHQKHGMKQKAPSQNLLIQTTKRTKKTACHWYFRFGFLLSSTWRFRCLWIWYSAYVQGFLLSMVSALPCKLIRTCKLFWCDRMLPHGCVQSTMSDLEKEIELTFFFIRLRNCLFLRTCGPIPTPMLFTPSSWLHVTDIRWQLLFVSVITAE